MLFYALQSATQLTPGVIDACNCLGLWGAGIALQLKKEFPGAYKIHNNYCKDREMEDLLNTCQLIPPSEGNSKSKKNDSAKQVWIACLFTSKGYGRKNAGPGNPGLSKKEDVVEATKEALEDFRKQLQDLRSKGGKEDEDGRPGDIASVKFNAGSFKVPWEETESSIKAIFADEDIRWLVVSNS